MKLDFKRREWMCGDRSPTLPPEREKFRKSKPLWRQTPDVSSRARFFARDLHHGNKSFERQEPAMEGLTRLVSESLLRHGLDRPVDYHRLRWSRWFRCESPHSLLQVPSKPGVFALAEEIATVGTSALGCPTERSSAPDSFQTVASATQTRRMLAVTHFFEDDDMAFVLDRMLTKENPLRGPLNSGRYFIRFVIIEDRFQRLQIHTALSQWLSDSAEKASGIGSHFASSLELTPATEYIPPTVATRSP
jgi:hypothetical protein